MNNVYINTICYYMFNSNEHLDMCKVSNKIDEMKLGV